ncbi:Blue-light-activated histidine kinase 1 [Devosia equisanguinis]|uniref:Blue-light-activated histidine kinase n=1 Tax=Devosia equisanguinis TaxID=2490941 RepID=A0A3S4D5W9_9HYPH|nr:PAS domain-containing protein [Devosia equisanguinis]VDS05210.1 Blue-light-activated histidine kinase 1 [Devosia equisanguinis]
MPKSLFPNASAAQRETLEQDPAIRLFNTQDWASNPLGPIPEWPDTLKGAVRLMVAASTPMAMMVGQQGILLYNNGYADFAGHKHPHIFGMPALEAWPEIADFNRLNIERGLRGESWTLNGQELLLNRHGELESVWMDLHYSPIMGDDGLSMGTLCVVHETTERVLAEQALARSEERMAMAINGTDLVGTWDWDVINDKVTADDQFAALFDLDSLRAGLGVPIQEFLRAIHPDDVQRVGEEIAQALREGSPYKSEYRLLGKNGDVTWVVASGRPRTDANGRVNRFPGVAIDVTAQHRAVEALRESELQFGTLADTMPQMVWSTRPDGFHDYYNARWYEFTGMREGTTDGEGWNGMFHPDDQERAWAAWRHSLATGEPYQIEYRLRHHSGEYRWTLGRALPIRGEDGQILRWIGTCTDIHESRVAAEERELVAQELSHRIKNIFAVLNGIIGLSARSYPASKDFADQLRQRIYALGEAHDFVRPHSALSAPTDGQGTLAALIARLMRPYNDGADQARVVFLGDDIPIDDAAATPLALLFHELATNAAKYGGLSAPGGKVELTGSRLPDMYRLTWRELGGPETSEPVQLSGFGSRLVSLSVEGQMRGHLEREWNAGGLVVAVQIPYEALSRSDRLRQCIHD